MRNRANTAIFKKGNIGGNGFYDGDEKARLKLQYLRI